MPNVKLVSVIFFSFSLMLALPGCSSKVTVSDTISEYSEKALLAQKRIEEKQEYPETINLLEDSAVVFSIFIAQEIPTESAEKLHYQIGQNLLESGLYSKMLPDEELTRLLLQKSDLARAKEIYLDTLSVVSVSDKDISNPLGAYLQAKNFLVFQVDQWPCPTCTQNSNLRMKLRLVDAASSNIVWTGVAEKKVSLNGTPEDPEIIALQMVTALSDSFYHRFKQKWHRQRFDNLAKAKS